MAGIGKLLVVGGGVAGLTAAAALHRHGFTTELVERQQTWHALGAGFLVHANGMRMLRSLGLAEGVMNAGAVVRRWQFCDEHGQVLSETDLEALWRDTGPCIGIERTKLQRALLPGVTTAAPSDLGAMNWRSVAPIRPAGLTALQLYLGHGCVFGLVPLGAGRTYGFAYVVQPRLHDPPEGRLDRLRKRFAAFGERVQEYLASLERDDQVICSAMEWMESKKCYSGLVVLVGDAAHASSPMMGQGGCMAMEDACELADELRAAVTVESALAGYVSRRTARVKWVQQQSMALADAALRERGNEAMQTRFGPLVPAP